MSNWDGGRGTLANSHVEHVTMAKSSFDDDSRKRKAAQSLKRHELKKKRIERSSLICNIVKEAAGQIP
jgi:hypothetical protein